MNKMKLAKLSIVALTLVIIMASVVMLPSRNVGATTKPPTNQVLTPRAPDPTNVVTTPADGGGLKNPLKAKSIGELVKTAVQVFSYIVIILAVLAFIWVGLQYILARGKPEKMKELSGWLGYIIIGVAVVLGAQIMITMVINTLKSTGVVDERVIQSANDALKP